MTRKRRSHAGRGTRGITFDTGMLIATEKRKASALVLLRACRLARVPITIPAAVIAEWWRGAHPGLLELGALEAVTPELARHAGELLARTGGSNAVDALVVASAAQRGDIIATADPSDLRALAKLVDGVAIEPV